MVCGANLKTVDIRSLIWFFLSQYFAQKLSLFTTITKPRQITMNNLLNNTKKKKMMIVQSVLKKLWELAGTIPVSSQFPPVLTHGLALASSLLLQPWTGSRDANDPMLTIHFSSNFLKTG